jgi:ribosomal protein S18 acetylase RimI-like enzyme
MTQAVGIRPLKDKARIEAFLRCDSELHVYSLGDLDKSFWPHTTWYGWETNGQLEELVLVYTGQVLPTVLAISRQRETMRKSLGEIAPLLPALFYAHLSPGVDEAFHGSHAIESHGPHYKMALRDVSHVWDVDCSGAVELTRRDSDDLTRLYEQSYPGNWFNARMLATGQYYGLRANGRLVSAAGVHVYSKQYRVAAIGNIVTHPAYRCRGYARQVTARLCQSLLPTVEHIGLNVKADNDAAIACYQGLGFENVAPYGEFTIARKA